LERPEPPITGAAGWDTNCNVPLVPYFLELTQRLFADSHYGAVRSQQLSTASHMASDARTPSK
jgi:hypothetical protein